MSRTSISSPGAVLIATAVGGYFMLSACVSTSRSYNAAETSDGGKDGGHNDVTVSKPVPTEASARIGEALPNMVTRPLSGLDAGIAGPPTAFDGGMYQVDASVGDVPSSADASASTSERSTNLGSTTLPDTRGSKADALTAVDSTLRDAGPTSDSAAPETESGVSPTFGGKCDTLPGSEVCDASNPNHILVCTGGWWIATICPSNMNCEPENAVCRPILAWCEGAVEGALRCAPDDEVVICGAHLVSSELKERCIGNCVPTLDGAECASPECGDGKVLAGAEQCDDANSDNTDGCTEDCKTAFCGDGYTQAGAEQCDDANSDNTDGCTESCKIAFCGDGYTQAGAEQCDDANSDNTDGCTESCKTAFCGDGYTQAGAEQCDDANSDNTDTCPESCITAFCGDGFQLIGVEECDDGIKNGEKECNTECQREK